MTIQDFCAKRSAEVYQYSGANLSAIVNLPPATVNSEQEPMHGHEPVSTIRYTYPANSLTLFVLYGHSDR